MRKFLVLACIFFAVFFTFFSPLVAINEDLGNHIKTGEIILQTHHIPSTNILSFAFPSYPIVNDSWLGEVYEYLLVHFFRLQGLLFISSIIPAIGVTLLALQALKKKSNIFAAIFSFVLLYGVYFDRADVRLEFVSQFFAIIFLLLLDAFKKTQTKWIFILPILMIVWVNFHVVFPIGIALIGIYWLAETIKFIGKRRHKGIKLNTKPLLILTIVLSLSVFATFINPYGITGSLFLFISWHNFIYPLPELQSIYYFYINNQLSGHIFAYIASVILIGVLFFLQRKKISLVDWFLFITFGLIGAFSIRNFPFFRIVMLVPLSIQLTYFFSHVKEIHSKKLYTFLLGICSICAIILIVYEIKPVFADGFGWSINDFGKYSVDFFIKNNIKGPIFNNLTIGSYLEYRLYPKERVFSDTKFEQTPPNFYTSIYFPMQENPKIFAQINKNYHFNSIVFNYTDPNPWTIKFTHDILQNNAWKLIYIDDYAMILVKNAPENKNLIYHFALNKNYAVIRHVNTQDKKSLLHIVGFFERAGWQNQELIWLTRYLQVDPNFCPGLQRIVELSQQKNPALLQMYIQRYQQTCQ